MLSVEVAQLDYMHNLQEFCYYTKPYLQSNFRLLAGEGVRGLALGPM